MSYILDALRKSEQERLASGLPNLNSGPGAGAASTRPQRNGLVLGGILLAFNAAALVWWFSARPAVPAQRSPAIEPASAAGSIQAVAPQPAAAAPPTLVQPLVATDTEETRAPAPDREAPDRSAASRQSRPAAPVSAPTEAADPVAPARKPAARAAPASVPAATSDEAVPAPVTPGGIIGYADLPAAVRKALPPLQVGGYVDGAGDTLLVLDDRLVREGDEVGPGVRVLKISPDGAVFAYRNYRFRR